MVKYDQIAIDEVKKYSGGGVPEAYFCAEKGFGSGILYFLVGPLLGGLLGLVIGKMYLVALQGEHLYFILTNGKCSKFKGKHFKIYKGEILEATGKKNRKLHNFRLKLRDGKTLKFEASEDFIYLEDRPGNIGKVERFLGIDHSHIV